MNYEPKIYNLNPVKGSLGFKFSNDVFLSEQFLIDKNISYTQEDLEDTPFGRCARIKSEMKRQMVLNEKLTFQEAYGK